MSKIMSLLLTKIYVYLKIIVDYRYTTDRYKYRYINYLIKRQIHKLPY